MSDNDSPTIQPGIYHGMSMDEYLALPAYSSHYLSRGWLNEHTFSAAHMKVRNEDQKPPTDSMKLGTLVHALTLEPELALQQFVVQADIAEELVKELMADPANEGKEESIRKGVRNRNLYRERVAIFARDNANKQVVDPRMMEKARYMSRALRQNQDAMRRLFNAGESEITLVWRDRETGLFCKRRPDKRGVEVKTCYDISGFLTSIYRYGYDLQAAMEFDGWAALGQPIDEQCFVVLESSPPFSVQSAPIGQALLDFGRNRYRTALMAVREGLESGSWPVPSSPAEWGLSEEASTPIPTFGSNCT